MPINSKMNKLAYSHNEKQYSYASELTMVLHNNMCLETKAIIGCTTILIWVHNNFDMYTWVYKKFMENLLGSNLAQVVNFSTPK